MQEKFLKSYSFRTDTSISQDQGVFEANHCSDEYSDPGGSFRSGKWTLEEHLNYIIGIIKYGNDWKEVQKLTGSRSCTQLRSHSQKFFAKIRKKKVYETFKEIMLSVKSLHESANKLSLSEFKTLVVSLVDAFEIGEETESMVEANPNFISFIENNYSRVKGEKYEGTESNQEDKSEFKEFLNIKSFINFCDSFVFQCPLQLIEEVGVNSERNNKRMNTIKNLISKKYYIFKIFNFLAGEESENKTSKEEEKMLPSRSDFVTNMTTNNTYSMTTFSKKKRKRRLSKIKNSKSSKINFNIKKRNSLFSQESTITVSTTSLCEQFSIPSSLKSPHQNHNLNDNYICNYNQNNFYNYHITNANFLSKNSDESIQDQISHVVRDEMVILCNVGEDSIESLKQSQCGNEDMRKIISDIYTGINNFDNIHNILNLPERRELSTEINIVNQLEVEEKEINSFNSMINNDFEKDLFNFENESVMQFLGRI